MKKPENYRELDNAAFRGAQLIYKYLIQQQTVEEKRELDDWINESRDNLRLFEKLTDPKYISELRRKAKKL